MGNQSQVTSPRRLRVFLCHSSGDKQAVRDLYQRLKACNVAPWLDEDNLLPGQEWEQEIRRAVRETDVVIVCLSHGSITKAGFVQKEIRFALDVADEQPEGTIFIIPLRLEECELPERLGRWHWVNYFEGKGFDRLMSALKYRKDSLNIEIASIEYQPSIQSGLALSLNRALLPHEPVPLASPSQQVTTSTSSQKSYSPNKRISRRTFVLLIAGGLTLAGGAGGGVVLLTRSHAYPPSSPASLSIGTKLYTYLGHHDGIRALAWSPHSNRIATGSDDYTAQIWDATTGNNAIIYRGHSLDVEGIAWSPDGTRIVSGSADGTAQIWNPTTGEHIYTYRGHIVNYQGSAPTQGHPWVNEVGWSSNGKFIVSCDQTSLGTLTATVQVWDATTGKTLRIYRGHKNGVYTVAWSPDSTRIASAGYDGTVQVWNAQTGETILTSPGHGWVFGLTWSLDGKQIAFGGTENVVIVMDANTGYTIFTNRGYYDWVRGIAWSPDGRKIAASSKDGTTHIFNAHTGKDMYIYDKQRGSIDAVGWSSDGKLIASGGFANVDVWQAS